MKRRVLISTLALATGLSAAGFLACGVDDEIDEEAVLRDAELEADAEADDDEASARAMARMTALAVAVTQIQVHHREAGWMRFETRMVFDLLQPETLKKHLGTLRLKPGSYDGIRLVVKYGFVQFGRAWYDLEIPSGAESGLKIAVNFCVTRSGVQMPTDWNVADYLKRSEQRGYWLEPSITVRSADKCPAPTR